MTERTDETAHEQRLARALAADRDAPPTALEAAFLARLEADALAAARAVRPGRMRAVGPPVRRSVAAAYGGALGLAAAAGFAFGLFTAGGLGASVGGGGETELALFDFSSVGDLGEDDLLADDALVGGLEAGDGA